MAVRYEVELTAVGGWSGRRTTNGSGVNASRDAAAGREAALPSGTVTFAFTDIEGSTVRWERYGKAMQEALRRHDALLRTAIDEHGGYIFKAVGDAFCAAFSRPRDAVRAMLAAQYALAAEDFAAVDGLRVRTALHTGTADERDGDYFGPTINRVSRLLGIASGGQVLISGVTSDIVQGALPPHATLRDLGEHRLKDLARPEHVFQLLAPDLPADFPALRSLQALPNNLPLELTSFLGRETEVAEITTLLETHRLITIVGSGGVGKTRVSLQVGAELLDGTGDGVWFIELAPLVSGDYLVSTVAQAMGITLSGETKPLDTLVMALKNKRALLIFDNCEHLVEAAAAAIAAILRGCEQISVIASTRQGLGIAGETTYRMPSLAVPQSGEATLAATDAAAFAAIALFVERAAAADNHFVLSDENAPVLAEICRRLDGIPLAIELAAARVRILSPRQLRARLDERFRVLTSGRRDALPRQQTLRALIDWSHDLLGEQERILFRRLGCFANGFTLMGAVAVAGGEGLDEFDIFDLVASLLDKSLVLAESAGDALRYRMLESTRAYAREKLAVAGEEQACAARHLRYIEALFDGAREQLEQTGRHADIEQLLATELEDVRVALDRAAGSEMELGGSLLAALGNTWVAIGLESEGLARIERFSALLPFAPPVLQARLREAFARIARIGRPALALASSSEAVAFARLGDDSQTLAGALSTYAYAAALARKFDAAEGALTEAERLTAPGRAGLRNYLLQSRAIKSTLAGDLDVAARAYEELHKNNILAGDAERAILPAVNLADVEHARGHTARAVTLAEEVLPQLRASRDRSVLLLVLANLTGYLVALDRTAEARAAGCEATREGLAHVRDIYVMIAIEHFALAAALDGELQRGARLAGYTEAAFAQIGFEREFTEKITRVRLDALLRERIEPRELSEFLTRGGTLTLDDAIALVHAKC